MLTTWKVVLENRLERLVARYEGNEWKDRTYAASRL